MDILYKPPMNFEAECKMLEKNFVTCLHEKSLHDVNVPMKCDVERVIPIQILWFMVDCPSRYAKFDNSEGLKTAFGKWQSGEYEGDGY